MGLALFDLDHTLLAGDSDYLWGCYLAEHGHIDGAEYAHMNRRFYDDYLAGQLDIHAFLAFQLRPLAAHDIATLHAWREQYLAEKIDPIILPDAHKLIARHRAAGDTPVIITATNRFITGPIAERLGVEHLLATEPELRAGRYTGSVIGVPCFQAGKITHLEHWLAIQGYDWSSSWFYSDSHNDLPLLSRVTHPVAVDPDDRLRQHAVSHGWPVISLRTAPTGLSHCP